MSDETLRLLRATLELLAAKRSTEETLNQICKLVEEIVPEGLASVMRLDRSRDKLQFRNTPNIPACVIADFGELTPGKLAGSCGTAAFTGQIQLVEDTWTDPRWESLREVAKKYGIRACWSVPVFGEDQMVLGTFAISRMVPGLPTAEQQSLLELAGYLASVTIRIDDADRAVRDNHDLLQAVIECAEDPIFVKDRDGRFQLVNRAEARNRGCTPEQMIGALDSTLYADDEVERSREVERRVLEEGESVVQEIEVRSRVDGQLREYMIQKDPIRNANDEITGLVGIGRDLTELRRVQRAMQQAQKLESLGVLAGGIAHDFNNLLVSVLSTAALLEQDADGSESMSQGLATIRVAAERARELTQQLLQYAGKRAPRHRLLDLRALLLDMPGLLSGSLSKNVELKYDLPDDLPMVEADPVQIQQVVMNLLLNAAEAYGESSGRIEARARVVTDTTPDGPNVHDARPGDWILLEIEDEAVGMSAETLGRIFDPFFTTKTSGRGLGLAAVQGIVHSHHGHLDVDSESGRGTRFRVWLPHEPAESTPQTAPTPSTFDATTGPESSPRVLVAEDEPLVADTIQLVLRRLGYEVVVATDGQKALDAFRAASPRFNLVIADYTMPSFRGTELARRLRAENTETPIVITSGLSELDVREDSGESFDTFLPKPFTPAEIQKSIERAQALRREALAHLSS